MGKCVTWINIVDPQPLLIPKRKKQKQREMENKIMFAGTDLILLEFRV